MAAMEAEKNSELKRLNKVHNGVMSTMEAKQKRELNWLKKVHNVAMSAIEAKVKVHEQKKETEELMVTRILSNSGQPSMRGLCLYPKEQL